MSQSPWLDGQLEDEGPRPTERIFALLAAGIVLGSVVLRGGPEALIARGGRASVGLCLVGLLTILFRDAIDNSLGMPSTNTVEVPARAIGILGWILLGLTVVVECGYWLPG